MLRPVWTSQQKIRHNMSGIQMLSEYNLAKFFISSFFFLPFYHHTFFLHSIKWIWSEILNWRTLVSDSLLAFFFLNTLWLGTACLVALCPTAQAASSALPFLIRISAMDCAKSSSERAKTIFYRRPQWQSLDPQGTRSVLFSSPLQLFKYLCYITHAQKYNPWG